MVTKGPKAPCGAAHERQKEKLCGKRGPSLEICGFLCALVIVPPLRNSRARCSSVLSPFERTCTVIARSSNTLCCKCLVWPCQAPPLQPMRAWSLELSCSRNVDYIAIGSQVRGLRSVDASEASCGLERGVPPERSQRLRGGFKFCFC